jgi:hypothetical protein
MNKKITGVHDSSDAARHSLRLAREEFRENVSHAQRMKG